MRILTLVSIVLALALSALAGPPPTGKRLSVIGEPELFQPGLVSTERSEVKITFSPDGRRMLWGTIGWTGGAGGWDIWESVKDKRGWGAPRAVSFNSPSNDFDPSFAPDGSGVYFFSNRPGGLGGDDIYFVAFDSKSGSYGTPSNSGPTINSAGDEWGPVVRPDGKQLLYCTNGRGGSGKHDLFVSTKQNGKWAEPKNLGTANSAAEDFDAAFVADGRAIVFASGDLENGPVTLQVTFVEPAGYSAPVALAATVNSPTFLNFGCSVNPVEPGVIYFTSNFEANNKGRADIYRVHFRLVEDR